MRLSCECAAAYLHHNVYCSTADVVRLMRCCLLLCVSTKIEKEKREHAKQHGMIRTEITGAEIAEEMEKERRLFQLQMCEVRGDGNLLLSHLDFHKPLSDFSHFSVTVAFIDLSLF